MCGIAGIINHQGYSPDILKSSLFHRGPDAQAVFVWENVLFVHTRLSIVDISSGEQPMHCGRYSIVFNGEIYNHQVLRQEQCSDFKFSSRSDTEVLLAMYSLYGRDMFEYLDGMFAFAILDRQKGCIFLARDRAGKKPLYYTIQKGSFIFASELNALKKLCNPNIDEDAVAAYVQTGFFPSPSTPYEKVYELEAGYWMKIDIKSLNIEKKSYFNIEDYYYKQNKNISLNEAVQKLDSALDISVRDRLLSSDLEVGAFLSGGIDSSLVVAKASKYCDKLKTFTVCFTDGYDESHLAKLTADKYKTEHHEIHISMNLKDDIEKILFAYGKPFMDSSAIPSFYVSREAKKYVTVILNGDGADELFGGYRRYVPVANNWLNTIRKIGFQKIGHSNIKQLVDLFPVPNEKKAVYNYLYRMMLASSKKPGLEKYLCLTTDIFGGFESHLKQSSLLNDFSEQTADVFMSSLTPLSQMLYLDFRIFLACDLLQKMDIATMANSLEARSPFLSKYIIEFACTLSDKFKVRGITTKFILRELAKSYLPAKLISQPKRGFEVPLKKWVEDDLKSMILDFLTPGCYSENFVEKKFLRNIIDKDIRISDEKRAKMLWTLFCLEVWRKKQ